MKKVLIITRDFPPNSPRVGWMIRMAELANFFARNEIEVHVLTCKRCVEWPGLFKTGERVCIHTIRGVFSYYDVPKEHMDLFGKAIKMLKEALSLLLRNRLIDIDQMDAHAFSGKAEEIIVKYNIANVFISTPPSSLHLAGLYLKNKFGPAINLIGDYRDAWTLRKLHHSGRNVSALRRMTALEQDCLNSHDHTIFVSTGMLDLYRERFKLKKPLVVENGYINFSDHTPDESFRKQIENEKNECRLTIGYFGTGSLNGEMPHKDFGNLLNVIKDTPYDDPVRNICIVVQGHVSTPRSGSGGVKILSFPPVSNQQARAHMGLLDICIIVHSEETDAPVVMGGKVYDYAASGVPIWLIVPENSVSLMRFAEKTKKPFLSNVFDPKSIEVTLRNIIALWKSGSLGQYGLTETEAAEFSRDNQYTKLLPLLH